MQKNFNIIPIKGEVLDKAFCPASLFTKKFNFLINEHNNFQFLTIALERESGFTTRKEVKIFPESSPYFELNFQYIERLIKFLLWQYGGFKLFLSGNEKICSYISNCYKESGSREFDAEFMGNVYGKKFEVICCPTQNVPFENASPKRLGGKLDGERIGFDLGASDIKVSAISNGKVLFSKEIVWEPRKHSNPNYHYEFIYKAVNEAREKLNHLDFIGGSSAGVIIDNEPKVASLFRAISQDKKKFVKDIFNKLSRDFGVPVVVINDGDVSALAGAMSLNENGVLGLALGSSLACGFVDKNGFIHGWLNELAFAPIDYSISAPVDEWSKDKGCGAQYLSQQCVFRLAQELDFNLNKDIPDAEKLKNIQLELENNNEKARLIWESMGSYLGYAIAHYANFYDFKHVLILGRCVSGKGGEIILKNAKDVLLAEFNELYSRIIIHLPDEKTRRVGQSIAAASLPQKNSGIL